MSKGSKQRPTDKDKFDKNFDRIFSKPPKKEDKQKGKKSALSTRAL